jgi:hypothetical protein
MILYKAVNVLAGILILTAIPVRVVYWLAKFIATAYFIHTTWDFNIIGSIIIAGIAGSIAGGIFIIGGIASSVVAIMGALAWGLPFPLVLVIFFAEYAYYLLSHLFFNWLERWSADKLDDYDI